jgi:uncharacterized protein (DUF934 family)
MKFIAPDDSTWQTISAEDGLDITVIPAAYRLLTLLQWHQVRSQWPLEFAVGVTLPNDIDLDEIVPDLPRLQLIALQFPKWVDGRAYSQARLLRARYRFKGDIRAIGEVLVDMVPLLDRTGFTSVALRADQDLEAAQRALSFFPSPASSYYQGDVHDNRPLFARQGSSS